MPADWAKNVAQIVKLEQKQIHARAVRVAAPVTRAAGTAGSAFGYLVCCVDRRQQRLALAGLAVRADSAPTCDARLGDIGDAWPGSHFLDLGGG
jgi:hypothetical protein